MQREADAETEAELREELDAEEDAAFWREADAELLAELRREEEEERAADWRREEEENGFAFPAAQDTDDLFADFGGAAADPFADTDAFSGSDADPSAGSWFDF